MPLMSSTLVLIFAATVAVAGVGISMLALVTAAERSCAVMFGRTPESNATVLEARSF